MLRIPILHADRADAFPPVERAMKDPDGLLCAGGDLSVARLLLAYRQGIFPWFNPGEPILWWSPDPRCVFDLRQFMPSRSLRRFARACAWRISADAAFDTVIDGCAAPRQADTGTWIGARMRRAYTDLHRAGHAHSIEAWAGDELVGGLYGVAIGDVFFGESMFSRQSNASKIVLHALARQLRDWGYALIDGQVRNPHLLGLGAKEIDRRDFVALLEQHCGRARPAGSWTAPWQVRDAAALAQR